VPLRQVQRAWEMRPQNHGLFCAVQYRSPGVRNRDAAFCSFDRDIRYRVSVGEIGENLFKRKNRLGGSERSSVADEFGAVVDVNLIIGLGDLKVKKVSGCHVERMRRIATNACIAEGA